MSPMGIMETIQRKQKNTFNEIALASPPNKMETEAEKLINPDCLSY